MQAVIEFVNMPGSAFTAVDVKQLLISAFEWRFSIKSKKKKINKNL